MNEFDLLSLIGEVDERYLEESERYSERPRIIKKWAVSAASLLLLTSLVLIPVKNGALGCSAAAPPDPIYNVFFETYEEFLRAVGKDSLLCNLSFDSDEITYEMFCHYVQGKAQSYVYEYTLMDGESEVLITAYTSAPHIYISSDRMQTVEICGEEIYLYYQDDTEYQFYVTAQLLVEEKLYLVTVRSDTDEDLIFRTLEDLLTKE